MMLPAANDEWLIEAKALRFAYGEGAMRREILHGVSASFRKGEITLITGPSGSGKSTFLTLIGALRRLQEGELRIFGNDLTQPSADQLVEVRRMFGYIFQNHNLIPSLSACENVQLALACGEPITGKKAREMALQTLTAVGLQEHADKYPAQLSGGQRQRVGIARALVGRPSILLADEPTASLDRATGREIVELLQRLAREQGCAVILVTHDSRILDIADRLLSLIDGNLEEFQIGLNRIASRLIEAAALLPDYLPSGPGAAAGDRPGSAALLNLAERDLAAWHERNVADRERQAVATLQRWLNALRGLETALRAFAKMHRDSGSLPGGAKMGDSGLQALEALLLTCLELMREPDREGIEMLAKATQSGGNFSQSYLAQRMREEQELSAEEMSLLLNFTGVLAQAIFFLRELADCLKAWHPDHAG